MRSNDFPIHFVLLLVYLRALASFSLLPTTPQSYYVTSLFSLLYPTGVTLRHHVDGHGQRTLVPCYSNWQVH
jgi:hypothetical protein